MGAIPTSVGERSASPGASGAAYGDEDLCCAAEGEPGAALPLKAGGEKDGVDARGVGIAS